MSASDEPIGISRRAFAKLAGCDEKQVRRAIEDGVLFVNARDKLDPAQLDAAWRTLRVDSKDAPAAIAAESADKAADTPNGVRTAHADSVAGVPVVIGTEASAHRRAVAHKEDFAGRLKELEYRQRAGELIDISLARQVLFDEARAARDAWLNWPTRFAALIAAELGLEADRVAEVLTNYVHKQLATLGEPSGEFRKG